MTVSDVLPPIIALIGIGLTIRFIFWPLVRDVANRKRARAELPGLAEEMNLKHKKGDSADEMGEYRGSVDGHKIAIMPDDTTIEIDLKGNLPSFYLNVPFGRFQRMLAPLWRLVGAMPDDENEFSFGDSALDRVILVRKAESAVVDRLTAGPAREAIETFLERHLSRLSSLTISGSSIRCSTVVGSTKKIYSITPEQVRSLLPDMLDLASTLESTLKA